MMSPFYRKIISWLKGTVLGTATAVVLLVQAFTRIDLRPDTFSPVVTNRSKNVEYICVSVGGAVRHLRVRKCREKKNHTCRTFYNNW